MLVLSRQRDQSIMIGHDVEVTVVDIRGDKVRLGISAPRETSVHRREVYDQIVRANRESSQLRPEDLRAPAVAPRLRLVMPPAPVSIRPATPDDLPAINAIYNHFVLHSTCTYQETPSTADERAAWFAAHGPNHPIIVAERDGEVVGWGSLSKFHPRSAYGKTVENSVYVRHDLHRQGIGGVLLAELLERAKSAGHHTVLALIDTAQRGSIALHEKLGFTEVARLREVGFKFGQWLDVVYLQRMV